jgi:hypothetical protein
MSFRTDVRNPQLGMMNAFGMDDLDDLDDLGAEDGNCMKTEACAHESTAGGGAKLEEIPRRCAPRNDKGCFRIFYDVILHEHYLSESIRPWLSKRGDDVGTGLYSRIDEVFKKSRAWLAPTCFAGCEGFDEMPIF